MPGWEKLDYGGNAMSPAELERQWEKIMRAPLIVRDRKYLLSEDVLVDETGLVDPDLGIMAKVSSLVEMLRLSGSYEKVYQLWEQFTLSAVRVNVDVTRSRNGVLDSISICPALSTWPVCIQFVAYFSPSFSTGCIHGFCPVASIGESHTGAAAWSSRNKAKKCGSFFASGIKTSFREFV